MTQNDQRPADHGESPNHDAGESLLAILDEMRSMVTQARSMPMSSSAIVNRAELLDLIESARAVVPASIAAADSIVADADAVLERARTKADHLVEDAHTEAQRLVSNEEVVGLANQRAEGIIADANAKARRLAENANDYCDRQLAHLENELAAISAQAHAGRQALAARASNDPSAHHSPDHDRGNGQDQGRRNHGEDQGRRNHGEGRGR